MTRRIIFAEFAIFFELFQKIETVAANMANRNPCFFGIFMRDFNHLLAALFIKLGNTDADYLPLGLWI